MPAELAVIVPTRGRPENIRRVISAWDFTNAWDVADLVLAIDADDPEIHRYHELAAEHEHPDTGEDLFRVIEYTSWRPMVVKLNSTAARLADGFQYFALGFAGDDHVPQTINWAKSYLAKLHEMGTGMVFGDDGYQGSNLSTEWAVTADAVRALGGRMVPATVEHMYCDNAMMDLFGGAGALAYLPEIRIEHMHPIAGKAETDEQYKRVNHRDQFKRDKSAYEAWRASGMVTDIRAIQALRLGRPDVRPVRSTPQIRPGSMPRAVPPRPRGKRMTRLPIPRHFKRVRGATPDEIGLTLADFATQVPKDQAIVELGVYQGRTALLMAWGARQGLGAHLWAIDAWDLPGNTYGPPFNEAGSKTWAEYNVMALGYNSGITLIQGFSSEQARDWTGPKIGLLFVDDDHSKEGALAAIELWSAHLAPSAIIAVDDYGHPDWPGVAEAVDELVTEGVLAPVEIFHDRLAVTRLTESATPRDQGSDTEVSTPLHEQDADNPLHPVQAITSEGVSPSPYPAAEGQVAMPTIQGGTEAIGPAVTVAFSGGPVNTEGAPPEGWIQDEQGRWLDPSGLNLGQLRALAKRRRIVLGKRKDLKADIIQALRDGA